jgi:hypothetical protein
VRLPKPNEEPLVCPAVTSVMPRRLPRLQSSTRARGYDAPTPRPDGPRTKRGCATSYESRAPQQVIFAYYMVTRWLTRVRADSK